jgi:hypothetical protein
MQTELYKNMVYEWADKEAPHSVERLLWLDQSSPFVWTIKIYGNSAQPVRRSRESLQHALDSGAARVLPKDPYAYLIRPERDIKESHRKHRDEAASLISSLVENGDTRIFQFYGRNSPVTDVVKGKRCTKSKVYRELRRYFQRGQIKNANLPLYDNCGWRDRLDNLKPGQKKLGRPSKLSAATGEPRGINITSDVLQSFRAGIKLFYDKRLSAPLKRAFRQTRERFFNCGYYQNKNGVWVPELPPANQLPTYRQFCYWYNKERKPRQSQVARQGMTRFNLSGRAKLGNSTQMAYGPGSIFQADATIGDAYLLSSLNRRWIIGRPVIYFIIDLFSRLIVGLSIALEGPSWLGAMLALENAVTDKVAFCAEYDISIEYSDWPSHHLPEALMADRGEFEGYNADQLVNAFSTRIYNTAPYRADLKGVVEQHIDLSNEKTIHWVPGRVRKRERGDRDYRLDAALTLWEFRKIMILSALHHNQHQYLEDYPLDADMMADGVEPYPINLWNWGLENRSGCLRKQDIETVRLNLLPEAEASVTQNGIYFSNLHYTSELALEEQWFERAGEKGSWKIRVAHDPRTRSRIYLRLDNGKRFETCHLVPADEPFLGRDWYETLDEFEQRKQRKESNESWSQRGFADLHASTTQVIDSAEEKNAMSRIDMSDRSRIRGIRANRKHERDLERQANAWELGPDPKSFSESSQPPVTGYVPPPQPMDKLRSIRERMLKK